MEEKRALTENSIEVDVSFHLFCKLKAAIPVFLLHVLEQQCDLAVQTVGRRKITE
jgi:hypothetical protein